MQGLTFKGMRLRRGVLHHIIVRGGATHDALQRYIGQLVAGMPVADRGRLARRFAQARHRILPFRRMTSRRPARMLRHNKHFRLLDQRAIVAQRGNEGQVHLLALLAKGADVQGLRNRIRSNQSLLYKIEKEVGLTRDALLRFSEWSALLAAGAALRGGGGGGGGRGRNLEGIRGGSRELSMLSSERVRKKRAGRLGGSGGGGGSRLPVDDTLVAPVKKTTVVIFYDRVQTGIILELLYDVTFNTVMTCNMRLLATNSLFIPGLSK